MNTTRKNILIGAILIVLMSGCETESDRIARLATQAADRQAAQNEELTKLNREVAAGTKRLVEQDAAARKELASLQRDIQSERTQLSGGWNDLESQRRQIAKHRRTESAVAAAFRGTAAVAVALLCLAFSVIVVNSATSDLDTDAALCEVMLKSLEPAEAQSPRIEYEQSATPKLTTEC